MPHDAAARALDSCRRAPRPVSHVFWRKWRGATAVLIALAQSEPGARPDWGAAVDAPPLRWTDEWLHEVAATTLTTLLGH